MTKKEKIYVIKEIDGELKAIEWEEKNPPLMQCGHVAQGLWNSPKEFNHRQIWACVICDGKESHIIAEQPNLKGRTARCTYFGNPKPQRRYANDECNFGCKGNPVCQCGSIKSSFGLPFFKYHPDKPQDEFYCGCFGWD